MQRKLKRSLSLLLTLAMVMSLFCGNAWATETTEAMQAEEVSASEPVAEENETKEEKVTEEEQEKQETETTEKDVEKKEAAKEEPETEKQAEKSDQSVAPAEEVSPQTTDTATSGTCGDNLTWKLEDDTLTISGSGAMTDWDYVSGVPWHSNRDKIKKVQIGKGVTSIGKDAFDGCSSLTSVTIPDGVTSVGNSAFEDCSSLTSVTIGNGVTSIGGVAFSGCSSLTSVYISDVSAWCKIDFGFYNANPLSYAHNLYLNGALVTELVIPDSVTSIGEDAFFDCSSLTSVTIPDSVTSIGSGAFYDCSSLTSVIIGNSVTSIGRGAFSGCDSLTEFLAVAENACYSTKDGVLFNKEGTELLLYPGGKKGQSYVIPDSVTSIGERAFRDCSSLTSVTIPDSVTSIGGAAFSGCSSLTSVTIGKGVTSISWSAFSDCSSLTSVIIPDSVTSIGDSAFYGCSSLTSVTIPDSVTSIGGYAFSGCSSLKSVTIPDSVTSIGGSAFSGCSSLTSVTIPDSVTSIYWSAFSDCSSLKDVYYAGSEEEWKKIDISDYNAPLTKATIHYNSTGGSEEETIDESVLYFSSWDAEKKIPSFGSLDLTGNQVTEETDTSFLEQVDRLVGHYVLVKRRMRTDGMIGPNTLLSIQPVETKAGTVTAADSSKITIGGTEYATPKGLMFPDSYVNKFVLYHVLQDGSIRVQDLETETGTLRAWNAKTKKLTISKEDYQLGECADEESVKFLGETKYTSVYVQYLHDGLQHIYHIEKAVKPTEPNYYETYVPETDEVKILQDYSAEWDRAYAEYMEAVQNALRSFAGTEGEKRENAVNAEAKRMQEADANSASKYLSGDLGSYSEYAYKALAEYLYDYTCDHIELTSAKDSITLVKDVMKGFGGGKKTYRYDNGKIEVTVSGLLASGSKFGSLMIEKNGKNVVTALVCSTQAEIQRSVSLYLDELKDLSKDSMVNVASAVCEDICGKSLSGLTKDYLDQWATKIEKRLAVTLTEKFNLAGVGDLFKTIDKCYSYYTYVTKNLNMTGVNDIEKVFNALQNLEFKDTTVKDALVDKAQKKLQKTCKQFIKAYKKYLNGTLVKSENGFFSALFKCPVDIQVFNSSGKQIGEASETELWYDDSIVIIDLGGAKKVVSLTSDIPKFKIISNGYGSLDCTVEEFDENHQPLGRLNYYDIDLTPGQEYGVSLTKDLAKNAETVAITTNDQSIFADEYISAEESAGVIVSCAVEADDQKEGGQVSGVGTYIRGNAVVLYAIPDSGYFFDGWYQGDKLISLNRTYEFTARNDVTLTAKFAHDNRYNVSVDAEEGGTVSGTGIYFEGEKATVKATPGEESQFAGWYVDGKKVSEDAEYQFTVTEDISLTAHFVITHHYESAVTKATLSQNGSIIQKCTVCDKVDSETVIYYPKTITASATSFVYTGKVQQPTVTVEDANGKKVSASDYTLTYSGACKNVGTYTVAITFKGNYSGTATKQFAITRAGNSITASAVNKTVSKKVQSFRIGAKAKGGAKLTYKSNNKSITVDKNGKVTVAKNYIGKATITISAAATTNYNAAVKQIYVTVNPTGTKLSSVTSAKIGQLTIKWTKNAAVTGYQVQYATSSKFTGAKTLNVKSNKTVTSTLSKLKQKQKYYVRIRTYKTVGKVNYYSAWSAAKSATVKGVTAPAAVKLTSVKSAKAGEMTVKWSKNAKAGGYQLQYATASNFKGAKAVNVKKAKTTSTTVKKLTKGKKYYVRVRTYQKVSGKTYYSAWSASKNVTIKK